MQQYREIKGRHQDAILFFRMGDFYEMFYDDAEIASRALGLTLTSRNNGGAAEVPLAGMPVKAAADYLRRLVQQGFRVAVCEQVEDPKLAKGIVRREVVETITPGAAFADDLLDGNRANYVVCVHVAPQSDGKTTAHDDAVQVGIAAADLSTGELRVTRVSAADAPAHLARLSPRELVLARGGELGPHGGALTRLLRTQESVLRTERDAWEFDGALAHEELPRQFSIASLEGLGFGVSDSEAVGALGALVRYLRELQPGGLPHLARPVMEHAGVTMPLDEMTRRNLELVESLRGGTDGTLLSVLDERPRQWVRGCCASGCWRRSWSVVRSNVGSTRWMRLCRRRSCVRRFVMRSTGCVISNDWRARRPHRARHHVNFAPWVIRWRGCRVCTALRAICSVNMQRARGHPASSMMCSTHGMNLVHLPMSCNDNSWSGRHCNSVTNRRLRWGWTACSTSCAASGTAARTPSPRSRSQERARTGIQSLKVGYNRVFGYYLEISNANKQLVPADYQRRQTLTGAERYVTPALKEYEEKVLGAAERIESRERELFEALRQQAGSAIVRLAGSRASHCHARCAGHVRRSGASREQYVRPELHDGFDLDISAGRHPVVERMMPREKFIPNDLVLVGDARLMVLTGPNMAGKSTILRQIGLIQLMAQIGAFVPARAATLPVVDRLFTRVGASDNLVRGQSTFMVEMSETSAILHTATKRSLVLLDEIGRGTTTYDGVSIAWSVSEHLHDAIGCKTVFATHYHELTQLAEELRCGTQLHCRGARSW